MSAFIATLLLFLGWLTSSNSVHHHEIDRSATADSEKAIRDRDHFQQLAEVRFKAMDLNLDELKDKAKNGRAVTRDRMKMEVDNLFAKTEAARSLLQQLKAATPARRHALKMRIEASLKELEAGFEQVFSRFMSESARAGDVVQPMTKLACFYRLHPIS